MFQPTVPLLEIAGRVLLVYAGLFLLLRLTGKKELGQLAPMDFLTMLLVSETVSPALTGGDESVTGGMVAAATLVLLTFAIDWTSFRSKAFARAMSGVPQVVLRDGKVDRDVQRRERLSDDELDAALRHEGIGRRDEVHRATIETNGRVTVVPREES
jgi:uncharacterized membrane protein YcaP (DUF421 family)